MMNKKGYGLAMTIMVTIMLFIIGITMVNFVMPEVTNTRLATTGLDCSNAAGISDGNKLTCLAVDLVVPYFIILIFSAAGGYLLSKFIA